MAALAAAFMSGAHRDAVLARATGMMCTTWGNVEMISLATHLQTSRPPRTVRHGCCSSRPTPRSCRLAARTPAVVGSKAYRILLLMICLASHQCRCLGMRVTTLPRRPLPYNIPVCATRRTDVAVHGSQRYPSPAVRIQVTVRARTWVGLQKWSLPAPGCSFCPTASSWLPT